MTIATATYGASVCPVFSPPTTWNGVPASFEAKGPSTLQVCVTGGIQANFSNLTTVYTGPATTHFGPQAVHGLVTSVATR